MKNLLFFTIFICFASCKSQNTRLYGLQDCIKKEEIQVLQNGLMDFESELEKVYAGLNPERRYIQFLEDFINYEISPDFFLNSELESTRKQIKELGIWTMTEESDEGMEAEISLDGSKPEKSDGVLTLNNEF